jgi:hypothetical protein
MRTIALNKYHHLDVAQYNLFVDFFDDNKDIFLARVWEYGEDNIDIEMIDYNGRQKRYKKN